MTNARRNFHKTAFTTASALLLGTLGVNASAASAEDLDKDAAQALLTLYKSRPVAEVVSKKAKAILVFPKVLKAGRSLAEATERAC